MKQTPLTELIELLDKHIDWMEGNPKAERVDIYDVAAFAQSLRPKEKQGIKDAYNYGYTDSPETKPDAEQYFSETYEETK